MCSRTRSRSGRAHGQRRPRRQMRHDNESRSGSAYLRGLFQLRRPPKPEDIRSGVGLEPNAVSVVAAVAPHLVQIAVHPIERDVTSLRAAAKRTEDHDATQARNLKRHTPVKPAARRRRVCACESALRHAPVDERTAPRHLVTRRGKRCGRVVGGDLWVRTRAGHFAHAMLRERELEPCWRDLILFLLCHVALCG